VPSPRCLAAPIRSSCPRAHSTVTDEALGHSSVDVTIDAAPVNTHRPARDNQVRSADFLGVEHFPNITFTSSAVRNEQGHYFIDGTSRSAGRRVR
jgi:polyisoprenoid-binding protein YceI